MSAPGRPEREYRSAKHEGSPVAAADRRAAQPQVPDPALAIAAVEARARVVGTRTAEGRDIVWHVWDETPGASARGAIVLLHGSFGSWTHWLRNVVPLASRWRVVVPDLPGFGDSGDAPDERSPPALAGLLRDGLAGAAGELLGNATAITVAGFSLGAVYAGWLARALTDRPLTGGARATRLALVSPGGLGPRDHPLPTMTRVGAAMDDAARLAAHRQNLAQVMFGDPANIDAVALKVQDANVARARFRGTFTSRSDFLLEALPGLPMPVWALWGERDAFDPDVGLRVAAMRSARPDAAATVVPRAGHWVNYEAAAVFERALADWLEADN